MYEVCSPPAPRLQPASAYILLREVVSTSREGLGLAACGRILRLTSSRLQPGCELQQGFARSVQRLTVDNESWFPDGTVSFDSPPEHTSWQQLSMQTSFHLKLLLSLPWEAHNGVPGDAGVRHVAAYAVHNALIAGCSVPPPAHSADQTASERGWPGLAASSACGMQHSISISGMAWLAIFCCAHAAVGHTAASHLLRTT